MKFKFKAQKPDGQVYEGERETSDKFSLYREIKREGGVVIRVDEVGPKKSFDFKKILNFFGNIKIQEKIVFAKNLSGMMRAGLSVSRALDVTERQSKNPKLKRILGEVKATVSRGETFHSALSGYGDTFPPLFISMVKAGEESGSLPEALLMVSDQLDRMHSLQRKVRGALIYPAIIFILMIAISVIMLIFIVPNLTKTFTELKISLPASTQFIITMSNLVKDDGLATLFVLFLGAIGISWARKTAKGKRAIDFSVLKLPIIGELIKEVNTARTVRTLSSLLTAGVDVVLALSITGEVVQNVYYKEVLKEAEVEITKGSPMSSVFTSHENLFPAFVGEMTLVGEETGKISEMFADVAVYYENSIDQQTKNLSTIIEPVIMVVIGVGVGFFALAMISPTLSLVNAI